MTKIQIMPFFFFHNFKISYHAMLSYAFNTQSHLKQSIYNYYFHRGYTVIIGKGIVEIISLFFTLVLSVFLFAYIDWRELTTCQDSSSCHEELNDYMISKVRMDISHFIKTNIFELLCPFIPLFHCFFFLCKIAI